MGHSIYDRFYILMSIILFLTYERLQFDVYLIIQGKLFIYVVLVAILMC